MEVPQIIAAMGNLDKVLPADSKLASKLHQLMNNFEDEDDLGTAIAKFFIK